MHISALDKYMKKNKIIQAHSSGKTYHIRKKLTADAFKLKSNAMNFI